MQFSKNGYLYLMNKRKHIITIAAVLAAFGGLASVIVRRTGTGTVILRAESEGLEAGETEL